MTLTICEHGFSDTTEDGYSLTEMDIGAVHATNNGYGRLTIRQNVADDVWEVYDLDHESVVDSNDDLEVLIETAQELTELPFEYGHDKIACRR